MWLNFKNTGLSGCQRVHEPETPRGATETPRGAKETHALSREPTQSHANPRRPAGEQEPWTFTNPRAHGLSVHTCGCTSTRTDSVLVRVKVKERHRKKPGCSWKRAKGAGFT
ncbi:hypothetical protein WMY93_033911 [Mugilogobius chulae]|uniref:Uncharacterized protein n=1 Tax=Mugilogobius chulae TaxID=88201 RepID=A0AAW0MFQ5_9GOBI